MNEKNVEILLANLLKLPKECEWVEFKNNYHSDDEIGETLSAVSNGACLLNQQNGYLVFGIEDTTQNVIGTTFSFLQHKVGSEEFESWLVRLFSPRIDLRKYEFNYLGKKVVLIEIPSAFSQPIRFKNIAYIRIGSTNQKLINYPEKERVIWEKMNQQSFEKGTALKNVTQTDIISLLDVQKYFDLLKIPFPSTNDLVIEKLINSKFIHRTNIGFDISNLGAILFAKDLNNFDNLSRKAVRVIVYKGNNKMDTLRDQNGIKGYASGFEGLISYINSQLPVNEEIGKALRREVRMYPDIAIRELVANTIIHQDFTIQGTGPMVEIYNDRIEFTNPGLPLIKTNRFIDEFQSRNEDLAAFMRRIGVCEEKGSGIDKVINSVEIYQLPAPNFIEMEKHTNVKLYSFKSLNDMDKNDKVRACYQHSCLKFVQNLKMTNQSLRARFKIEDKNSAIASRIIKDTINVGLIKEDDPDSNSRKFAKYIPFWA